MVLTTPLLERLAGEGRVHVVATPANAALLEFIADKLGVAKGTVTLKSGQTSRRKVVEVRDALEGVVASLLG